MLMLKPRRQGRPGRCVGHGHGRGGAWSALLGTRALAFLRVLRRGAWVGQVLRPRGSEGCGVRGAGRLGRSPGLGAGRGGKVGGQDGVQSPNPSKAFGMWGFEGQPGLEAGCPEAPWPALPTRPLPMLRSRKHGGGACLPWAPALLSLGGLLGQLPEDSLSPPQE